MKVWGGSKTYHPQKQQTGCCCSWGFHSDSWFGVQQVFLGCFVGFVRGFYGFLGEKQLSPLNRIYHLGSCQGEVLVRLPAAAAVSVSMDASAPAEPSLAPLEGWWMRHPRSSIRLAAKLVFQRETFAPYIEMLYPLEQIYAPWLWPKEDLRFLPPRMVKSALARKEALETAYEDLESEGLSDRIPRDLFLRAHHAAASRAFAGEAWVQRVAPFEGFFWFLQMKALCRILNPKKAPCLDQEQRLSERQADLMFRQGEVPASRTAALAVGGLSLLVSTSEVRLKTWSKTIWKWCTFMASLDPHLQAAGSAAAAGVTSYFLLVLMRSLVAKNSGSLQSEADSVGAGNQLAKTAKKVIITNSLRRFTRSDLSNLSFLCGSYTDTLD